MKIGGIVGGIGPESTIDYYRLTLAAWRERTKDISNPPLIINSIDLETLRVLFEEKRYPEIVDVLAQAAERLVRAGATVGLLAANTPHIVFDNLQKRCPLPLISIVEAVRDEATRMGVKRVGLLGTGFTMQAPMYPDAFAKKGIEVFVPSAERRAYIHEIYFGELVKGIFLPQTTDKLTAIIQEMKDEHGIQGLILGGTELPLALRGRDGEGVPFLDTAKIHVEKFIAEMLS